MRLPERILLAVPRAYLARLLGLSLLLFAPLARASVIPMTLAEVTHASGFIFAGTVRSLDSGTLPGVGPITRVTFTDLDVIRGETKGGRLVLTIRGGVRRNLVDMVADLQSFGTGERYIVFAGDLGSAANSYDPIVGGPQGLYRVRRASGGAPDTVFDAEWRPVTRAAGDEATVFDVATYDAALREAARDTEGIRIIQPQDNPRRSHPEAIPAGRIVSVRRVVPPAVPDPGTRVTEAEFLAVVRELAAGR